jgi:hypothetical protein
MRNALTLNLSFPRNRESAFGEFYALESRVSIEFNISEIGKEIERKEKSVQQKAAGSNSVSVYTARNGAEQIPFDNLQRQRKYLRSLVDFTGLTILARG